MSKRNRARRMGRQEAAEASRGAIATANDNPAAVEAFTFGDPEPVLSRATMLDMLECWHNARSVSYTHLTLPTIYSV